MDKTSKTLSYGYKEIDKLTGGLQPGELILVVARPGMGKTSFIYNVIAPLINSGRAVTYLYGKHETENQELRLLRYMAEMELNSAIDLADWCNMGKACERLSASGFYCNRLYMSYDFLREDGIDYMFDATRDFNNIVKNLQNAKRTDVLIIDEIQPVKYSLENEEGTAVAFGDFFMRLKRLAAKLSIPIIVVVDWPRICETRREKGEDARLSIEDLSTTSVSEDQFDTVIFLYRDDYYYWNEGDLSVPRLADEYNGSNCC